jgi:hypothetical protein
MIKISINIEQFHPAIIAALPSTCDSSKLLEAVNEILDEAQKTGEIGGGIKDTANKKTVVITASGKLGKMNMSKDSTEGLLARVHWSLERTKEVFCRVETVTLPASVMELAKAKRFAKEPATVTASA